jgi:hypothetical protein
MNRATLATLATLLLPLAGCGSRAGYWDSFGGATQSYGLNSGVALVDNVNSRVIMLTALPDQSLATPQRLPIGHNETTVAHSADGSSLLVVSTGDLPQRTASDEPSSLTLIAPQTAAGASGFTATRYNMKEPTPNLAIDPSGTYAVGYTGATANNSFLQNKNDIVIFKLGSAPAYAPAMPPNPVARSLRSFGGTPQQLTFTPPLQMPDGTTRRLLIIESEIDVTLLDLDNAFNPVPPPEITVRLTSGTTAQQLTPAGVAVDPGDFANGVPPRIAVRTSNDTNLITLTIETATPASATDNDFVPTLNLTDVGGVPSDIQFVKTDAGLRVAALVPSKASAVLVEPDASLVTVVSLPSIYENLSLVTADVSGGTTSGADVAMLWSGGKAGGAVALWTLSSSVATPYRSVEVLDVSASVASVFDVGGKNPQLKILQTANGLGFYVLDLNARTAAPLDTTESATLAVAPDGLRLWAFAPGTTNLAVIGFNGNDTLGNLAPTQLSTDLPIAAVYDVSRADGGRSLIAIHNWGNVGATVFDALNPSVATAKRASALVLEGP